MGWGLLALATWATDEAAPKATLLGLRRYRDHIVERIDGKGRPRWTRAQGGGHQAIPFVAGGVIVPALAASLEVTRHGKTQQALRRLIAHLDQHAIHRHPQHGLSLARTLYVPSGSARPGASGQAAPEEVMLYLAGIARAKGRRGLPAAARNLLRRNKERLQLGERKYLGRPLSLLLRSWPFLE